MNDAGADTEISYATSFPLPYRVLSLAGIGILGWATNLHGLDALGIDVISTMDLDLRKNTGDSFSSKHNKSAADVYRAVYRIAFAYASWCLLSWILFRFATRSNTVLVDVFGYVPGVTALVVLFVLVCPFDIMYKSERDKFISAIKRCAFPSSMDSSVYFADVVFADIFTSFAKVLGDVWLCLLMLFPGSSMLHPPAGNGLLRWVMPTIMSLPYFVRFRQCIREWSSSDDDSRRPLYNALKYATAFPLIYLSAAQRIVVSDLMDEKGEDAMNSAWHGEHPLFRLWLLSAAINSLYSFWWDITNDWGLELLKPKSSRSSERPLPRRLVLPRLHSGSALLNRETGNESDQLQYYGLRSTLLYPLPVYPFLVFLNFFLRMSWSVKLSSHLHSTDGSITIFLIEVAEIVRRWMWVFIRVEWEYVKKARERAGRLRQASLDDDEPEYELNPPTPELEGRP
ncbi:EXS-domain-containing protein [Dendrothele bispora CBS 962.96]|uniref:EXS-domain-containing protein n=1 Tax=Dendrothele bispora (strain CBS 962.96) TaxID=1314807 RepID=A0A4S8MI59_DENBC|nr:EXS-domain-containing protein [Dendrothele bispora CBS 962.96]